jgi:hypothetical protein
MPHVLAKQRQLPRIALPILAVPFPLFTVRSLVFCSMIGFAVKAVAPFQHANDLNSFFASHLPLLPGWVPEQALRKLPVARVGIWSPFIAQEAQAS